MNDSKLDSWRTARLPMLAFLLASVMGVTLIGLRIMVTGRVQYLFLIWNLFLAWLPLAFALAVHHRHQRGERGGWRIWGLASLWLLFFPNAPYIFTDLYHLTTWFYAHFWIDLSLLLLVAFTGFLLGFVSLYLMQSVVAERVGQAASWLFIFAVAGLSGFGIYLGRFLRLNSWDVVLHPFEFSQKMGRLAAHPLSDASSLIFTVLFATFLFLGYLMLYALTHLQPRQTVVAAS